jgi:hypothetical protein
MKAEEGTEHLLVPSHGGLLVRCDPLEFLSRIPSGVVQALYLEPPLLGRPQGRREGDQHVADYRTLMEGLLKHARRVLSSTGNLFVRFPVRHDHIDMTAALGQLFGDQKPHLVTFPGQRRPGLSRPGPRSDRETMFLVQVSSEAVYNPKMLPVDLPGAIHQDARGAFRWETLERAAFSSSGAAQEFHGTTPPPGRTWKFSLEKMEGLLAEGRIGKMSLGRWALKRYADEVAPVEASLDWEGIPIHTPHSERVSAKGTQGSRQEPLALMERIVEVGSHEGDLVVVISANEYGSGAVACRRLGRRWLTTVETPEGLDVIRERLLAEGATFGADFGLLEPSNVLGLDEYPVDGTPLLLAADQMVQAARELAALRQSVVGTFESEFEKALAGHLLALGVVPVREFRVPGTQYRLDFFLPEPPFGIIEIKSADHGGAAGGVEQLRAFQAALGTEARLYLVLLGEKQSRGAGAADSHRGVTVVASPTDDAGEVAKAIAADFLSHRVRATEEDVSPTFAAGLAADTDELSGTLSTLSLNLDALFLAEGRTVLEHEIRHLRDEIGHGHLTAAALRVGRSLEFIIYAACRSWGVPVREPILVGLAKLEGGFNEFASALLAYAAIEAEDSARGPARRKAIDLAKALQGTMLDVVADVDGIATVDSTAAKPARNPQALVNDIGKTHARLEEVRSAVKEIKVPLAQLLKLRNAAAHSSTDGEAREVGRGELLEMMGFLNSVLMSLSRCGTAIVQAQQAIGEPKVEMPK